MNARNEYLLQLCESLEEDMEWIDQHDCHKSATGEDGCTCDAVAERIKLTQKKIADAKEHT